MSQTQTVYLTQVELKSSKAWFDLTHFHPRLYVKIHKFSLNMQRWRYHTEIYVGRHQVANFSLDTSKFYIMDIFELIED